MDKSDKVIRKDHIISTRISWADLQILEMRSHSANKSISDLMREALQTICPPASSHPNSENRKGRSL